MELAAEISTKNVRKSRFAPSIVLANNDEGIYIAELLKEGGFAPELDWSDIYPYWLVAKDEEKIVGCVQVNPGKPIGRIEMLALDQSYDKGKRANIAWRLYVTAISMLRAQGSQLASAIVFFDNKNVKKGLKKRGAKVMGQGNLLTMRIN